MFTNQEIALIGRVLASVQSSGGEARAVMSALDKVNKHLLGLPEEELKALWTDLDPKPKDPLSEALNLRRASKAKQPDTEE